MKLADITRPLLRNRWTRIPAGIILWPPAILWAIGTLIFGRKGRTIAEMARVETTEQQLPEGFSDPPMTDSDREIARRIAGDVIERRTPAP